MLAYPLFAELLTRPANCDPCALETYLSDEEFATIFKMDKEAFNKLAKWKRDGEKKVSIASLFLFATFSHRVTEG